MEERCFGVKSNRIPPNHLLCERWAGTSMTTSSLAIWLRTLSVRQYPGFVTSERLEKRTTEIRIPLIDANCGNIKSNLIRSKLVSGEQPALVVPVSMRTSVLASRLNSPPNHAYTAGLTAPSALRSMRARSNLTRRRTSLNGCDMQVLTCSLRLSPVTHQVQKCSQLFVRMP